MSSEKVYIVSHKTILQGKIIHINNNTYIIEVMNNNNNIVSNPFFKS